MRRHAEDLLWADNLNEGRQVLRFIKAVTSERTDARDFFKRLRRRLGLLGKEGFDLFGYNELFAPRIKWEVLKDVVENLREIATTYEDAYNELSETIEREESFEQIARQMSAVAGKQVEAEKKRLQESQLIAESEKRLYVKVRRIAGEGFD
ncbi:hypothetical protein OS493_034352 [Desmophyllum pertusum]|uniref:Uncharacterized protein n=1 Tax=Desmophyllum pertusum TaxID=174260 RepID=A0A9W9Y7V2_9CNID|nr:hypothetical protein OS493_034352 [Desmophyllum pertusum]